MTSNPTAFRDRLGTLRNLPRLFSLVSRASPPLAPHTAALYVGMLIIDVMVQASRLALH